MIVVQFNLLLALTVAVACCSLLQPLTALAQEAPKTDDAVYLDEPPPPPEPAISQEGPLKEEYEPGKTRVERMVRKMSDDQIVNHGKFTEYYRNGQKFAEGNFNVGVHEGPWSFWHDNGQLSKTVTFKKGMPDGAWEVFRADGTLLAKRGYKNGQRDGTWTSYNEDGKTLSLEQTYADGKLNGKVIVYFKSGKPKVESVFKDNERNGKVIEWDESGRKIADADYVAGKMHGKLVRYAADGTTTEETYQEGRRVQAGVAAPAGPVDVPVNK
jgi:antitoxin component YwqK of YwqJK toxin-antitoxin module